MTQCLINTLHRSASGSFAAEMQVLTTDSRYVATVADQDEIGWCNLLFGRIATGWKKLQHIHYISHTSTSRFSSIAWSKRFVGRLYRLSQSLLKFRCTQVHGVKNKLTSKREKKVMHREIHS